MTTKDKTKNAEQYNLQRVYDELYQKGIKKQSFKDLMSIITSKENIMLAYRNIKKNKGSHTPGLDGKTITDIASLSEADFIKIITNKFKNYKPKNVKRVEIPKANGKLRPLGIPSIIDRIIQQCILQVLEPICEAHFYDKSCGFRPNRSTENAIAITMKMMQQSKLSFVVDVDIESFFDNVNHNKLIQQMWSLGIQDKTLLSIIKTMLKATVVLPNGEKIVPTKGTPQGGILSPLLSNIVLNELDWWVASQWEEVPTKKQYACEEHENGSINRVHKYEALRKNSKLKEMYIVRYADDFKIFCRSYKDAQSILTAVTDWLEKRLSLKASPQKTKITNLKKDYTEFLGFKLRLVKKGKKYVVCSHICDKALERIENDLKEQIDRIFQPKDMMSERTEISKYNAKIIGIHNYYGIATCVQLDLDIIQRKINYWLYHKFKRGNRNVRLEKHGTIANSIIREKYGHSKQVRFIHGRPILPIGYIRTRDAMHKKRLINKYTEEGRSLIGKKQPINMQIMIHMMETTIPNRSIEYNDNRIIIYAKQKGKCAILGILLEEDEIHCHHIVPWLISKDDSTKNLIILHKDIHALIHAKKDKTIKKYLAYFNLTKQQMDKINKYRKLVGNSEIM